MYQCVNITQKDKMMSGGTNCFGVECHCHNLALSFAEYISEGEYYLSQARCYEAK